MKYKIKYETHVHKLDGTYDRKTADCERTVSENYKYRCLPYWKNCNKVEVYNIDQIKKSLKTGYFNQQTINGGVLAQYLLSEGETIDGIYHYEKITNITEIN